MKKIFQLFLLVTVIMPVTAFALSFEVDGIYYRTNGNNATVTNRNYNATVDTIHVGDIIIPETVTWNDRTYTVTAIDNRAFYGAAGMTSITLPNTISTIGKSAFYKCTGLTSITIPESVTFIDEQAFRQCSSLDTLNFNAISCQDFSQAGSLSPFYNIPNVNLGDKVERIPALFGYDFMDLKSLTIPNSVTYIGEFAFYYNFYLTSLHIPSSVTHIGNSALHGWQDLVSITVDEDNPIYDSRDNCNAIIETATNKLINGCNTTIIPNTVTSIDEYAFMQNFNSRLQQEPLVIPNSVTSIGYRAFAYTGGIKGIHIGSSVTSIGDEAFAGTSDIATMTVDENNPVYDSRDNCNAIIETATNTVFAGCKNTVLPESVTAIGPHAFDRITSLYSFRMPNSITHIGNHAFYQCTSLSHLTLSTSLDSIADAAFYSIRTQNLIIPKSVTYMGRNAIHGSLIYDVYCYIPDPSLVTTMYQVFEPSSDMYFHTLHVPAGSLEAYQNDSYWSSLFGLIVEIEPTGDSNGDGVINIQDITTLIDCLLGDQISEVNQVNADLDFSGDLSISDVTAMIDRLLNE